MAKRTKKMRGKKIARKVFYDLRSHAFREKKHQKVMEKVVYESRKQNMIYLAILFFGVALGIIITITVLKLLVARFG
jgi:hypothetical protein